MSLPDDSASPNSDRSDAVVRFMDRAKAQGVDIMFDEETSSLLVSICRQLDGMPLAIELAAARLRSMAIADLHDRLNQRFRLLVGGSRSALPRQQTLLATVEWSYEMLNPDEQAVLRRLSVFAGGFDLEAVEFICTTEAIDGFDAVSHVGSLVDKSLVAADSTGATKIYRLLETIREFSNFEASGSRSHCSRRRRLRRPLPVLLSTGQSRPSPRRVEREPAWFLRLDRDLENLREEWPSTCEA